MTQTTLAVLKPDAVAAGVDGLILQQLAENFTIQALKRGRAPSVTWVRFYQEHAERPFFPDLVEFMASGAVVVVALSGVGAVRRWRDLMGTTDPRLAFPGTIRRQYGNKGVVYRNAVHGSATPEDAARELAFWFTAAELAPDRELSETPRHRKPFPPDLRQADPTDAEAPRRWRYVDPARSPGAGRPKGAPTYGTYFPTTDLNVNDMGARASARWPPYAAPGTFTWLDEAPK